MDKKETVNCTKKKLVNIVLAFVIPTVIMLIAVKREMILYAINDDTGMRSMADGIYGGTPDGHLTWTPYVYGWVISCLYRMIPQIDWYGFFVLGMPVLALCVVAYRVISGEDSKKRFIYYGVTGAIFLVFVSADIMTFQWTISSVICAACAYFLFYTNEDSTLYYFWTWFFFFMSYCIRPYSLYMAAAAFVPLFLFKWKVYEYRNWKFKIDRMIVRKLAWVFAFIGCYVLFFVVHYFAYNKQEWREYSAFTYQRALIYDYYGVPAYEGNEAFYRGIGLSEEEVALMEDYHIGFMDELTTEQLDQVVSYSMRLNGDSSFMAKLTDMWTSYKDALFESMHAPLTPILGLFTLALIFLINKKETWIFVIVNFFWIHLVSFLAGWNGKFPYRISKSLCLLYAATLFSIYYEERKQILYSKKFCVVAGILLVLLTPGLIVFCEAGRQNMKKQRSENRVAEKMNEYYVSHPDNYYVCLGGGVDVSSTVGYTGVNGANNERLFNKMYALGWGVRNPLWMQKIHIMGAETLTDAVLYGDNVYLSGVNCSESVEDIIAYYRSKGTDCKVTVTDQYSYLYGYDPLTIYKLEVDQ